MSGQSKLRTIRNERNQLENEIVMVTTRINRIRNTQASARREILGMRNQLSRREQVRQRRESEQVSRIRKEMQVNSRLYDLQEQVRVKREFSRTRLQELGLEVKDANRSKAVLVRKESDEHRARIERQMRSLHEQRERCVALVKQEMERLDNMRQVRRQGLREQSLQNYRLKCKFELKQQKSEKRRLKTLQAEEQKELQKLRESESQRESILERFNRTIEFRGRRASANETSMTKKKHIIRLNAL